MTLRLYRYLQATTMMFLGMFLAIKIFSGTLSWYIHQRFLPLTMLAVIALFVIGQALFREARRTPSLDFDHDELGTHHHSHVPSVWQIWIVLLPLAIGILVPARPLDTQALSGKGVSASAPITAGGSAAIRFDLAADERNILDWIHLFHSDVPADQYLGQTASVIGFVYHDPRLPENQFLVSRFAIVCCTADAFAIGMVVDLPPGTDLKDNAWVKVKGPVQATTLNGEKILIIQTTSIEPVQQPDQPYLFP